MATAQAAFPRSLSVYRGQSRQGIGEGPERPITHGEQYLRADPPLDRDAELLDAARPWMSLDSDPADHQRLHDGLEAWSCFQHRRWQLVVRLVSAGSYDKRAAYFAHGRAWKEPWDAGFDPGLHLGNSAMFESPWRDEQTGQRVPEHFPAVLQKQLLEAEPQVAARLLAHLLQGCVRRRPVILAAPLTDFTAGSPLHALVSFARGGLPADLKPACRIRVYTRTPELFVRHLHTTLIAVPEEVASEAQGLPATLLDRQGHVLEGKALEPVALAYAEEVCRRAIRLPEGLTRFSERFRDYRLQPGLPSEGEVRTVEVIYNLAVALAGSPEVQKDLLLSYLPQTAQKLGTVADWTRLLTAEEWKQFPLDALQDLLLLDSTAATPGVLALQEALQQARVELTVDSRFDEWLERPSLPKLRRLLQLFSRQKPPDMLSKLSALPISELAKAGPVQELLAAELAHGTLGHRSGESTDLAELASDPKVFEILRDAVEQGMLSPQWAAIWIQQVKADDLIPAAGRLLGHPGFWTHRRLWGEIPLQLLDALLRSKSMPRALLPVLQEAGRGIDWVADFALGLRLVELATRAGAVETSAGNELITGLWSALNALAPGDRDLLVAATGSPEWRCLSARSLVDGGELRVQWLYERAERWLAEPELVQALSTRALLELGRHVQKAEHRSRLRELLGQRMAADPEEATDALIAAGEWAYWRREEKSLPAVALRKAAMAWMISRSWQQEEKEALREDWRQVVADLSQLSTAEMCELCGAETPGRLWPWIPPFEEDQLRDLIALAPDLGALADFAEAVRDEPMFQILREPSHRWILRASSWSSRLPPDTLLWLIEKPPSGPLLDSQQCELLVESAGRRQQRALQARQEGRGPAPPAPRPFQEELQLPLPPASLEEALLQALIRGQDAAACWQQLVMEIDRVPHLLLRIAERACQLTGEERREVEEHGWPTFEAVAAVHPRLGRLQLVDPVPPLFALAASLSAAGGLGNAVLRLTYSPLSLHRWGEVDWWQAILRGLHTWRRQPLGRCPDDREDLVLALLVRALDDMAQGEREQQAFWSALTRERQHRPAWNLPAEFGVRSE